MIEEVIKKLIEFTGDQVVRHSVILGATLNSEHAVVTLRGETRRKFFVKMARTIHSSGRILYETEMLRKLLEMKVENIPEMVLSGACDGRAYLVENFIEKSAVSHPPLSEGEKSSNMLEWIRRFYSQTKSGTVEPQELIQRAERVTDLSNEFIDLSDALGVLDKSKPSVKIPAVCRHGDIADVNFILTDSGIVAIDFGFARFNEPPSEPYALVSPARLMADSRCLDVLSVFDGVDPFFFAMYENIIRFGEELKILHELEENLLVIDRTSFFVPHFAPQVQLENIKELGLYYLESRNKTKAQSSTFRVRP